MTGRTALGDATAYPTLKRRLLLAAALTLLVIGWAQLLHATVLHAEAGGTLASGLLHWLRDSLLALPMGVGAVLAGYRVARRLGVLGSAPQAMVARAGVVSLAFLAGLTPGVSAHEVADSWFAAHFSGTVLAPDTLVGAAVATPGAEGSLSLGGQVAHALSDGAMAQALAFPLLLLLFHLAARRAAGGLRPRLMPRIAPPPVRGPRSFRPLRMGIAALALGMVPALTGFSAASAAVNGQAVPSADPHCGAGSTAPQRTYNIDAINVPITLNRFGVHDPTGFMYVLDQNEQSTIAFANAAVTNPTMLSIGIQDDPLQPLVIRANMGDCVTINLRNDLTNGFDVNAQAYTQNLVPDVSIHIDGVAQTIPNYGGEVGDNPDSFASHNKSDPNHTVTYSVFADPALGEGAHLFHSHGEERELQVH